MYRYNVLSSTLGNIHAILISRNSRRVTEVGYFWLRLIVINLIRLVALKILKVSAEFDRWCWTQNIFITPCKRRGDLKTEYRLYGSMFNSRNPKVKRVFKNYCYLLRSLLFILFILLEPLQNSPSLLNSKFLGTLKYKIHK